MKLFFLGSSPGRSFWTWQNLHQALLYFCQDLADSVRLKGRASNFSSSYFWTGSSLSAPSTSVPSSPQTNALSKLRVWSHLKFSLKPYSSPIQSQVISWSLTFKLFRRAPKSMLNGLATPSPDSQTKSCQTERDEKVAGSVLLPGLDCTRQRQNFTLFTKGDRI